MRKAEIDQFLAEKKIAFVGVSRTETKFSNKIYEQLKKSGHQMFPVHTHMESFNGDACVSTVAQLPDDVNALLIVASPQVCASVLKEVTGANVKRIWISSIKTIDPKVKTETERLKKTGANIVTGYCPFMFLEPVESVHSFHRLIMKLFGKYPK